MEKYCTDCIQNDEIANHISVFIQVSNKYI